MFRFLIRSKHFGPRGRPNGVKRKKSGLLLVLKIRQAERLLVLGPQQLLEGGGGGGFFLLHVDVAVRRHAGARGGSAGRRSRSPSGHAGSTRPAIAASVTTRVVLERGRGDERLRRQRRFRDAEEQWCSVGRLAAAVHHLLVLLEEAEAIDLLVHQEVRVAHPRDPDRPQHLTAR